MTRVVRERENQLLAWIYNTMIHFSGVIEDAARVCPKNRQGRIEEDLNNPLFGGFLFPHNLATIMNAEIRDLLTFIAPVLLPIFGAVLPFCYPALPVRIAVGSRNYSLMRFVRGEENLTLVEKEQTLLALNAYAMLKEEELVVFNVERIRRTRHNKTHDIANEIGAAEWVHGPIDRYKQDSTQFLTFQWAAIKDNETSVSGLQDVHHCRENGVR